MKKKVTIIGGGFSGLTAAYFLVQRGFQVTIYEEDQWGGCIQTIEHRGALIELAANGYLASARFEEVSKEIGARVRGVDGPQGRYILTQGQPRRWPLGIFESGALFGFLFKMIFYRQRLQPKSGETVAQWVVNHLSLPVLKKLVEPALRGIYAGDVDRLSASLIMGKWFRKEERPQPAQEKGLHTGQSGMLGWLKDLKAYLEKRGVQFHHQRVVDLKPMITTDEAIVIVATPPGAAAQLLATIDDCRSDILRRVEMLPIASVTLLTDVSAPLQGFGCLFPAAEKMASLGVLFRQSYFPEKGAPPQERWIMPWRGESEHELLQKIENDRRLLWGDRRPEVRTQHVKIWPQAMPHYTVELEKQIPALLNVDRGVLLHGNYLGALGLTALLERSFRLAESINAASTKI